MPHILTAVEYAEHLGLSASELTPQAIAALEDAELLFEAATGRTYLAVDDAVDRTEVHDGTGSDTLYLLYPISTLTSVKIGYDVANPYTTLSVTDQTELVWSAGSNRLVRVRGDFGYTDQPRWVHVAYKAQADVPDIAKTAIRAAAELINERELGRGAGSERVGGYAIDYTYAAIKTVLETNDLWQGAVNACKRWVVL